MTPELKAGIIKIVELIPKNSGRLELHIQGVYIFIEGEDCYDSPWRVEVRIDRPGNHTQKFEDNFIATKAEVIKKLEEVL